MITIQLSTKEQNTLLSALTLSPKQLTIAFRKVPRYWKQIKPLIPEDKLSALVQAHVATAANV